MNNKELKQQIDTLNAQYGDALDRHDYDTWMDFFSNRVFVSGAKQRKL